MELVNLNSKEFGTSVANLTLTTVTVYKVKNLYIAVKDALNEIWENVLNICLWFDKRNHFNIQQGEYIAFGRNLLARNDYDVDILSENLDFFYGGGAFNQFCKALFILDKMYC